MNKLNCFLVLLSSGLLVAASNKIKPANQAELDKTLAMHEDKPKVVEFFATWCGHCRTFDRALGEIAPNNPDIVIIQLDVEKFDNLKNQFGVQGMPTSFLFERGKELKPGNQRDSVVGADRQKLENSIASLTGKKAASAGKKNETNDVKAPSALVMPQRPAMPAMPQSQPQMHMNMIHMAIHQMLGEDIYNELKGDIPPAVEKLLESDKIAPLVDRLADLISDVVKEVVANMDFTEDFKTKLTNKLADAKKGVEDNFNQVGPMIQQMNPTAHKLAKTVTDATAKVIEKTKTNVAAKKATKKEEAPKVIENKAEAKPAVAAAA